MVRIRGSERLGVVPRQSGKLGSRQLNGLCRGAAQAVQLQRSPGLGDQQATSQRSG